MTAVPGTRGSAALTFAAGRDGTILTSSRAVAPLRVHRAFEGPGGCAIAQLVHVGPGLFAGDAVDLHVAVAAGAHAVVVPQSATKVHTMPDGGRAEQTVRIDVAAEGRCEVHGGLVIPFPGASLVQRVEVHLEPGAAFLWTERWSTGRSAASDGTTFRSLDASLHLYEAGVLRYADRALLSGAEDWIGAEGLLEGHRAWASGVTVGIPGSEVAWSTPSDRWHTIQPFEPRLGGWALRSLHHEPGDARDAAYAFANDARSHAGMPTVDYLRYGS